MTDVHQCECVSCSACGGTGNIWFSFGGRYLGRNRCDDLDRMESCQQCRGGIVEMCTYCIDTYYYPEEDDGF